jgi:hypothetical protein
MTHQQRKLFTTHLQQSCDLFNVSMDELFTGKTRRMDKVKVKCHFTRSILIQYPQTDHTELGMFLRHRDHTTISYYLYACKAQIPIPPFGHPRKTRYKNYQRIAA